MAVLCLGLLYALLLVFRKDTDTLGTSKTQLDVYFTLCMLALCIFGNWNSGSSPSLPLPPPQALKFDHLSVKASTCLNGNLQEISKLLGDGQRLKVTKHDLVIMRGNEAFFLKTL